MVKKQSKEPSKPGMARYDYISLVPCASIRIAEAVGHCGALWQYGGAAVCIG